MLHRQPHFDGTNLQMMMVVWWCVQIPQTRWVHKCMLNKAETSAKSSNAKSLTHDWRQRMPPWLMITSS